MTENKYNLYELQKKIPYEVVAPILTAWDEQSDNDVTDLARMAYDAGRNSISKEKNKMAAVAALFGKKLGEEFWIQGFCGVYKVKFTDGGILYLDTDEPNNYRWRLHSIDSLLTGKAEKLSDDDWRVKQTLKDLQARR